MRPHPEPLARQKNMFLKEELPMCMTHRKHCQTQAPLVKAGFGLGGGKDQPPSWLEDFLYLFWGRFFRVARRLTKNIDVCLIDRFITFWIFGKQLRSGVVLAARAMLTSLYKLEKLTITHELKILIWPRCIHTPSWNEVFTFPAPAAIQPFLMLPPCCTLSVQAEAPLTHWHVGMGLSCSFLCDG